MKFNLGPKFAKLALKVKRFSPEIATGAGILLGAGCVIVACVQTTKLGKVADEAKEKIEEIHKTNEASPDIYPEKAMKSDLVKVYARSGVDIVRLYALPAGLGALSVACIIGGHKILRKENAALAAAYMALNESFMQYRKRVVDKQGEDADRDLAVERIRRPRLKRHRASADVRRHAALYHRRAAFLDVSRGNPEEEKRHGRDTYQLLREMDEGAFPHSSAGGEIA